MRLYQLVDPDFARIAEQITRPRNARFLGPHFLPILRVADEADPKVSCPVTWGPAETRYFQGCLRSDHYPQTSHRQICIDLLHSSLIAIEFGSPKILSKIQKSKKILFESFIIVDECCANLLPTFWNQQLLHVSKQG